MSSVPVEFTGPGCRRVAGDDNGVAGQGVRGQRRAPLEESAEAGLHQIVYLLGVADASPQDLADEGNEGRDVVGADIGGLAGYQLSAGSVGRRIEGYAA